MTLLDYDFIVKPSEYASLFFQLSGLYLDIMGPESRYPSYRCILFSNAYCSIYCSNIWSICRWKLNKPLSVIQRLALEMKSKKVIRIGKKSKC